MTDDKDDVMTAAMRDFPLDLLMAIMEEVRATYPTEFESAVRTVWQKLEKELNS